MRKSPLAGLLFVLGCSASHTSEPPLATATGGEVDAAPPGAPDAAPRDAIRPRDAAPTPDANVDDRFPPIPPGAVCPPGVQRWCSDAVYDNGRQTCLDDGTWGPCIEPTITEEGLIDRPNTECGCRYFYFTFECCEDQMDRDGDGFADCWIPEDWHPPECPSDGSLCSYCDLADECGGEDDLCMFARDGYAFCSRDCTDEPCPDGYECSELTVRSGVHFQCVPVSGRCE
jgi:hypothetical protein